MAERKYQPRDFESHWQEQWEQQGIYHAKDFDTRKKQYVLVEFPYPSGEGLHVGHCLSYIAQDIVARYLRMKGNNVLYPIGWDAFGLPAENFAIKHKVKPQDSTKKNIANFKRQIQSMGISFDWSRELNTTDPKYYRWTQWIFLQLFKAGLAEKKEMPINWCPKDKIGLAFEEVVNGCCERCGAPVERRNIKQWILKITKYADRLIDDLKTVNFLPAIAQQQINWIGRSEGAEIDFAVSGSKEKITVFTTRPDTLFGATYMVLSPEHEFIEKNKNSITNFKEVSKYISVAKNKSERERQENREKTGVALKGIKAINPANKKEIPIWVADYVLSGYGTGAIMAVPAHDLRDNEFAHKFRIHPIVPVIIPESIDNLGHTRAVIKDSGQIGIIGDVLTVWQGQSTSEAFQILVGRIKSGTQSYFGEGRLINSGKFDGLASEEAKQKITKAVGGEMKVQYKLRDWIFSRQHYWGEPIPIIHCETCGEVAVPEKDLPVVLPDVEYYEPTDTGESPLAKIETWVNVQCPNCHGDAKRETDTMPNWAGSSWYFMRYTDPHNDKAFADKKKLKYWMPVDLYNGGAEHTTLHVLYSRFWYKFLYDQGYVPTSEPYQVRVQHGMILAPDGQKMSKSRGNVINPDEIIEKHGADIFRLYMMFMGEYDQYKSWNDKNLQGVARFMRRLYEYVTQVTIAKSSVAARTAVHRAIRDIGADLERRSFNTAVSKLMICLNSLEKESSIDRKDLSALVRSTAPFAPHLTEELWHSKLSEKTSIHRSQWPDFDASAINEEGVTLGVQVNGKVRADIVVTTDMSEADVRTAVLALESIQKYVPNPAAIKKFIYVKGRIISIVV